MTVDVLNTPDAPQAAGGTGRLWCWMRAKAIWWRALGWPHQRIARALGCSEATVALLLEGA